MPKFLNKYEEITYEKLRQVAEKSGAHVFPKVRLADILPINDSGISSEEFSYALKSHVDFLITDSKQEPQFCVEFDGPSHTSRIQSKRDELKNGLFKRFNMSYLRINSRYLESKYRGLDLLTYFVDVWFLAIAFEEAQSAGQIPYDEPFDPTFIMSDGSASEKTWPYWLSLDPQIKIQKLYENKTISQMSPSHWIGEDIHGNLRCIAWLFITTDICVCTETGMREHQFRAVYVSDLLNQISVFDIYESLIRALEGRGGSMTASILESRLNHYKTNYKLYNLGFCSIRGIEAPSPFYPTRT